jgi:two-component system invasion response regulator UvrY
MIRIVIADDHAIVRRGLRQLLEEESDVEIVADVSNAADLMVILRKELCHVLLLDMTMPQKHGLDILEEVRHEFSELRVLILSMHPEEHIGIRALKAGASGYLTKDSDPDNIIKAIRKVHSGGKYITPILAELLELQLHHKQTENPHELLSSREFAVFLSLAQGRSNAEIANELSLSIKTVNNYRMRALQKMNLKTSADIITYAHRHNLVS